MSIKSALRAYLAVSYSIKSILLIGSLRSPPPIRLRRTSPYSGGRIKDLAASLRKRQCTLHRQGKRSSHRSYCPTACGGKVVRSTKGGSPRSRRAGRFGPAGSPPPRGESYHLTSRGASGVRGLTSCNIRTAATGSTSTRSLYPTHHPNSIILSGGTKGFPIIGTAAMSSRV